MPLSHDITLPITHPPLWPPACILCGEHHPDALFSFRAGRVGWDQLVTLGWAIGSRPKVHAPACAPCARRLRRHRRIRSLLSWAILIPATIAVLVIADNLGWFNGALRPYRKYIAAALVLAATLPYHIWDILRPQILDATARGRKIDYEFADADYAALFAEMNEDPA